MKPNEIDPVEILTWYAEAGVDIALADEPINRFEQHKNSAAAAAAAAAATPVPTAAPAPTATPAATRPSSAPAARPAPRDIAATAAAAAAATERAVPDANAVARAGALAKAATSLDELKTAIEGFDGCNLKFTARSTVFADGNPEARLMLIGEAPGRDEDVQGLPFVGSSGQLLNRMLAAIGLDRNAVYISNILPWRPPGNRAATPAESEICRPFIERHIELAAPDLIMLVGGSSAKTLLRSNKGIMSLRGKWQTLQIAQRELPAMPCLHPAYLLRTPNHKALAWNDLLAVQARLQEPVQKPVKDGQQADADSGQEPRQEI